MMEFTFDFLARLKDNAYLTMLDGAQLVNLWEDGIISYNPEIQRGSRIKVKNNEEIEEAVYSKTNVKKIYAAMVAGNYFEDLITLNLLEDGNSSFSDVFYDETNEFNAFTTYGKIDIADGVFCKMNFLTFAKLFPQAPVGNFYVNHRCFC